MTLGNKIISLIIHGKKVTRTRKQRNPVAPEGIDFKTASKK
jgi:hypothetical protein